MSILSTRWFSEQEIEENSIIQQFHMNSIVGEVQEAQYIFPHSFTTNNDPSYDDLIEMKPPKILETTYISPSSHLPPNSKPHHIHRHSSSRILSFEDYGSNDMEHEYSPTYLNSIFSPKLEAQVQPHQKSDEFNRKGTKRAQPFSRNQSNAQDHIIAERKRREKLTQRFVALSALVPGLKKMDKASVLGDAIKHIKYLQESVKEYEEQKKEKTMESVVLVKKSSLVLDENHQPSSSSSSDGNRNSSSSNLPEIEVRVSGKDVLIKILCEKQKGNVIKIMGEIEKLGLSITNSNVLPFGPTFDISIIAQKNNNFDMKIEDVVKNLSFGLSKLT